MSIENRLTNLEMKFRPRDERGRCPSCGTKIPFIEIDSDGNPHCGRCKAALEPQDVPRNVKSYGANIDDGDETTGD